MDKQEARGIAQMAGWIFVIIGVLVIILGFLRLFVIPPISEFVSAANRQNFALFTVIYGAACLAVGTVIFKFAKRFLIDKNEKKP
ncbi:MAG: hypothetical protein V1653_03920 [bacterium]